jgi:hypothetical protein
MTVVFMHIPKAGGTSLRRLLSDSVDPARISAAAEDPDLRELGETRQQYSLFMGHFSFDGIAPYAAEGAQLITLLRHPVDRVASLYRFWRAYFGKPLNGTEPPSLVEGPRHAGRLSFVDFVLSENPYVVEQARNGVAKRAFERLVTCAAVGFVEGIDQFVEQLSGLGILRKGSRISKLNVTSELEADDKGARIVKQDLIRHRPVIESANRVDLLLYAKAWSHFADHPISRLGVKRH